MTDWKVPQDFEAEWWGDCANSFGEETKQITYAHRMGFVMAPGNGHWPHYDMGGKHIVDLGGGPASILLKCANLGDAFVVDPCDYPAWTVDRYNFHGVRVVREPAETFTFDGPFVFDEAWIYNVLQHVDDPEQVVATATRSAKVVRIFDWLDTPPHEGHPHEIKREDLSRWLGASSTRLSNSYAATDADRGVGYIEDFRTHPENGCDWIAYYGIFLTGL
jgi:hypothetical protein